MVLEVSWLTIFTTFMTIRLESSPLMVFFIDFWFVCFFVFFGKYSLLLNGKRCSVRRRTCVYLRGVFSYIKTLSGSLGVATKV